MAARLLLVVILALSFPVISGCTHSAEQVENEPKGTSTSLPPPDAPGTYATQSDYRIGPLDQLDISVYQVADLTRSVEVDASGSITLPLIGTLKAAGRTVAELQAEIGKQLGAKYINSPQVTVAVKQSPGQRVTVAGAVSSPGLFPIVGKTSLLQAVALAGGMSDVASSQKVSIFRNVKNQRVSAMYNLKSIQNGKASDPEVFGGDIVVVGESGIRMALKDLRTVTPLASFATFIP